MRREKRQTLFQEQEDFSPFVLSKSCARVAKVVKGEEGSGSRRAVVEKEGGGRREEGREEEEEPCF